MSEKYQFTIFDFAQAKKEAHLKQLKIQLVNGEETLSKLWYIRI